MPHQHLVGTSEVARLLSKSNRTVHRLVASGDLTPAVVAPGGFNGSWLFERAEVDALIAKLAMSEAAAS